MERQSYEISPRIDIHGIDSGDPMILIVDEQDRMNDAVVAAITAQGDRLSVEWRVVVLRKPRGHIYHSIFGPVNPASGRRERSASIVVDPLGLTDLFLYHQLKLIRSRPVDLEEPEAVAEAVSEAIAFVGVADSASGVTAQNGAE